MNWQSVAGICALVCLGPWLGLMVMGVSAWACFEVVVRVSDWRAGRRLQRDAARRHAVREALARTCDGSKRWGEEQARAARSAALQKRVDDVVAEANRFISAPTWRKLSSEEAASIRSVTAPDPDETQRWRVDDAAGRTA